MQPRQHTLPLDALVIAGTPSSLPTIARGVDDLPAADALRGSWQQFSAANGGWQAFIDERTGLPLLARGNGIAWVPFHGGTGDADPSTLVQLEQLARSFLAQHRVLTGDWNGDLVLDRDASGTTDGGTTWQVVLRQVVDGVPVAGARYDFAVGHGKLVAFGATNWGAVRRGTTPAVDVSAARSALLQYLGPAAAALADRELPLLHLVPQDPRGLTPAAWTGARGAGLSHGLLWRFVLGEEGAPPRWVAEVDADSGRVVAFYDDTKYDRVMGGVFPVSNDGQCPTGCEQPGFPLPFADISENGIPGTPANDAGLYTCNNPGSTIRTTLAGPYIRVHDTCGQAAEVTTCDNPLDLKQGPGTDCVVPPGTSAGNTHSARSSFYHLNRVMQKGRAWLPDNAWLKTQVTDNINLNSTCNAFWDGASVNFYKSGGGCRNTGEIAGVFVHEWGHGLDANDGGGMDNPSEAYADIVAFFETRESCVGRGFFADDHNCGGYGDACLNCSGIRDQDWDKHAAHRPATPQGFLTNNCSGGSGPCGKEVHCEGYVGGEALWDLAVRDMPTLGLDEASAWQTAERLFYQSRKGSGGNAYNCALPNSDGCGSTSWFQKLMLADDDDGNLANGTPHGSAIYAAFARHGIACGSASDPANQSSSSCPALAKPLAFALAGSNSVIVSWAPVPGAASYRILRNDLGCERAQIIIDQPLAPATEYLDDGLPNGFTFFYRVQAVGTNPRCESPVSDCTSTAGQPFAGRVRFDKPAFGCSGTISVTVKDGNVGAPTLTVTLASDNETTPESVTLVETPPGSSNFIGSIAATTGAAVHGDGQLTVAAGSVITAAYRDADTGQGQPGVSYATSVADCSAPLISGVTVSNVTDGSALVSWTTSEPTTGRVDWGTTPALGNTAADSQPMTTHAITIQPFNECALVYFRVFSTDNYGNTGQLDAGGAPFQFNAQQIPGAIFRDDFDTNKGWTLPNEWQIGTPQGKGNPGDPPSAFSDTKVLGDDLTGLGAHPFDYEPRTDDRAISPVINAGSLRHGELKFRRWLNVGGGGIAYIEIKQGSTWATVWNSDSVQGVSESSWSLQTLDISKWADSNQLLQIAFRQFGGPSSSGNRSGWNVDRMIVRDGSLPDYQRCAACGGPPTFSGAQSASDVNPCADNGVTVSWQPAPSWGTGTTGTYVVFRDTNPTFTPSAANRVASGVSGTSWTDTAVLNGTTYYYVVRAENDEACGTGPHNGGVVDANTVRASVTPTSVRGPAAAIGNLSAATLNIANVRLTWGTAAGASSYGVYRSLAPATGFTNLASTPSLGFDDAGAILDASSYYYSVRGANACGAETP